MKLFSSVLIATLALGVSAWAQENRQPSRDVHRAAVETYVNAARVQMDVYRAELEARINAAPSEKERLAPASDLVKRGDELILRLRSAASGEFDPLKAEFERNREALKAALGRETHS
jgi:hypothetical protein